MSTSFDPSGPATNDGMYGLPDLPDQARVVLVPVGWEPTASYGRGTKNAPQAIRRASWQVELSDLETGRPYEAGIAMLDEDPDIARANIEATAAAQQVMDSLQQST